MKTNSNDIQRNLLIGGAITMVTLAFAMVLQRKRNLSHRADELFGNCESALKKLGERVGPLSV